MALALPRLATPVVVGITVIALLGGCAAGASSETAAPAQPTVFVAQTSLDTLDPLLSNTIQNDVVSDLLYDPIVDFDTDGTLVPRVATEWTISDDLLSVELTLRDDILFSDGTPLTAADVVYSLDRIKAAGAGASQFLGDYASAEATDDTHVTITLANPSAVFVGALAKVYVLNSAVVAEQEGDDLARAWLASNAAGSGAYTLEDFVQATTIRMAINEDYWAYDAARPTTYVLQAFGEPAAIATALRGGTLNLGSLPASEAAGFEGDANYQIADEPTGSGSFVFFNLQSGPTTDPVLREAISLAYDYQGHVDTILGGYGTVASSVLPASTGCLVDMPEQEQDLDRAAELIEQGGYEGLELTLFYQPSLPEHAAAATLLQSNLRDLGITLNLLQGTFPEYNEMLASPETTPDLAIANDRPRYPEAFVMLNSQFNSAFVGSSNRGGYSNPDVDALLAEAKATPDADARCAIFQEVEEIVADESALMPLANARMLFVASADVSGIAFSPVRLMFDPMTIRIG